MNRRPEVMPQNVKEAAEMFALGSIALSQLAEQVETSVKPMYEIGLLQWALEYAEAYYAEYERQMNVASNLYGV